jgi:hypothetical protein
MTSSTLINIRFYHETTYLDVFAIVCVDKNSPVNRLGHLSKHIQEQGM